ncbi:hypothetical protein CONPUDRAFT_165241 [Coniophora puteana RWD-64-598 SS2]|uniref:Uncharacterized protein n=1 Tax=Coniophora puteana (strain RWD-64-598) TaxID=741705 RepID=A0A5M3MR55_CONPW|nr:uncharacterized protein CONPUDRAFT_165241 [Coniophora puteana RWD-64-598 SS2]EIW81011.1 hypothetical protein CONPUDRAFT_165241 [Coniophora puteana RWD-64-598 SS2]
MASDTTPNPHSSIFLVSAARSSAQFLLQKLRHDPALVLPKPPSEAQSNGSELTQSAPGHTVPWTITNKYYTADVSVRVHDLPTCPTERRGVPALVYVWAHGEPYRAQVTQLAKRLYADDFEVALAVRVPRNAGFGSGSASSDASKLDDTTGPPPPPLSPSAPGPSLIGVELDEDEDIDAYLVENGFEFVDVREESLGAENQDRDTDDGAGGRHDIPGLGRVVDALSTIMWPSLVRVDRPARLSTWAPRLPRNANVNVGGTADDHNGEGDDEEGSMADLDDLSGLVRPPADPHTRHAQMARELAALERWLDDGMSDSSAEGGGDGGGHAHARDAEDKVPISLSKELFVDPRARESTAAAEFVDSPVATGFDDDFTVFVSAPPSGEAGAATLSLPVSARTWQEGEGSSRLRADSMALGMGAVEAHSPRRRLGSSASFGSTFSFNEEDDRERERDSARGEGEGEDGSGRSTPAQDDAHLTPHHSSGVAYHSLGSVSDFGAGDGEDEDLPSQAEIAQTAQRIFGRDAGQLQSTKSPSTNITASGTSDVFKARSPATSDATDSDAAPAELEAFDLQSVFGALQGLKEEISLMPDDAERRRAAARVALGLVYGMGEE